MKKILFIFIATLGLTACDTYTVKNGNRFIGRDVEINGVIMKPGSCHKFVDSLLFKGDFPLKFSNKQDAKSNSKEYGPANYNVLNQILSFDLDLEKTDEPCEVKAKSKLKDDGRLILNKSEVSTN